MTVILMPVLLLFNLSRRSAANNAGQTSLPWLQRRQNQTWATCKWFWGRRVWPLLQSFPSACWTSTWWTERQTHKSKRWTLCWHTDLWVTLSKDIWPTATEFGTDFHVSGQKLNPSIYSEHPPSHLNLVSSPSSSRRGTDAGSGPEGRAPSGPWKCCGSGICPPQTSPCRSALPTGAPPPADTCGSLADTWAAPGGSRWSSLRHGTSVRVAFEADTFANVPKRTGGNVSSYSQMLAICDRRKLLKQPTVGQRFFQEPSLCTASDKRT